MAARNRPAALSRRSVIIAPRDQRDTLREFILIETPAEEPRDVESVSPLLHLGAVTPARSTWLGPAWAAVCGWIASAAMVLDGSRLLVAAFLYIVVDWAWPAIWTTSVRTDWLAPIARLRDVEPLPARPVRWPEVQAGSPGDRLLTAAAHFGSWWRSIFMPMAGHSLSSGLAALLIAVALSAALGWRALALTLAALAVSGLGTLRALRAGIDSDTLRAMVYGALPWWLGHAAFAPLSVESASLGVLFGLAYRAVMTSGEHAPSHVGLVAPQVIAAMALLGGDQPVAAFAVAVCIVAQIALRAFLTENDFARRAQVWLMIAMLAGAVAVA
ncbi:MAG TPA: hypothetical protein VJ754_02015 [Anaerolineae bacterium]|nr:hypothetical protein [Anaerolineae bacterium]